MCCSKSAGAPATQRYLKRISKFFLQNYHYLKFLYYYQIPFLWMYFLCYCIWPQERLMSLTLNIYVSPLFSFIYPFALRSNLAISIFIFKPQTFEFSLPSRTEDFSAHTGVLYHFALVCFPPSFPLVQRGTWGQRSADLPVKIDLETLVEQSSATTSISGIISLHQRLVKWSEVELTVG